jgi:hypothetical protein
MGNEFTSVKLSAAALMIAGFASAAHAQPPMKMGPLLRARAALPAGWSEIIVQGTDEAAMQEVAPASKGLGGMPGRSLPIINGMTVILPGEPRCGRRSFAGT